MSKKLVKVLHYVYDCFWCPNDVLFSHQSPQATLRWRLLWLAWVEIFKVLFALFVFQWVFKNIFIYHFKTLYINSFGVILICVAAVFFFSVYWREDFFPFLNSGLLVWLKFSKFYCEKPFFFFCFFSNKNS